MITMKKREQRIW